MNLLTKQKQTHREQTYGCQKEGWGERIVREFGWTLHTAVFKTDNWQRPITHKTLLSVVWHPGSWGKMVIYMGFSGGSPVKESACNAGNIGDVGLIPGSGRSPGGGHGNPFQCSYLENPMNWGACQATVYEVTKSQTQLKRLSTHAHMDTCVCMAESLCCSPETLTTLLIGYGGGLAITCSWVFSPPFWPPGRFSVHVWSLPAPKVGMYDLLIFYSNRI